MTIDKTLVKEEDENAFGEFVQMELDEMPEADRKALDDNIQEWQRWLKGAVKRFEEQGSEPSAFED